MSLESIRNMMEQGAKDIAERKKTDREYTAVVLTVTDAQLLWFLKERHPDIWDEFKEFATSNPPEREEG